LKKKSLSYLDGNQRQKYDFEEIFSLALNDKMAKEYDKSEREDKDKKRSNMPYPCSKKSSKSNWSKKR
jgi:thiamine biosynthesis protein ThiC